MTLSPLDALVASWFLQAALAMVFTIALWGLARGFEQKAIRALALGWMFYTVLVLVTLAEAWMLRIHLESWWASRLAGAFELGGVLASCAFWSPVAGLLVNDRRSTLPTRQIVLLAVGALLTLITASAVTGRLLHVPGSGPFWFLYPLPYVMLAADAWRSSARSTTNRAVLRILALGYLLFVVRITMAKGIMMGYTTTTATGDRLLGIASIQVLQMAAFGVVCLVVALALERTAILSLATRSRNAELAAFKAQRLESLGRMTAGIAHDFNNVLTAMVGAAALARDAATRQLDVVAELGVIDDAVSRARQLVRHLLDFARQRPSTPSRFSVNELLTGDGPLLSRAIGHGLTFTVDAGASESHVVMDPAQLTQVILNLVTNARDAIIAQARDTLRTGGTINILTRTETFSAARQLPDSDLPAGRYLVLSVKDSGQGIPPDVMPNIFEPFFTTKGEARGTGLGLATAYRVINEAGGAIIAESQVGVGTRFDIYLPLADDRILRASA